MSLKKYRQLRQGYTYLGLEVSLFFLINYENAGMKVITMLSTVMILQVLRFEHWYITVAFVYNAINSDKHCICR